jgi:hypothetical protein
MSTNDAVKSSIAAVLKTDAQTHFEPKPNAKNSLANLQAILKWGNRRGNK